MATIVFLLVVAALLGTKALDMYSTWRHVGVAGEANPLAASWLRGFGRRRGLAVVGAVYVAILAAEVVLVLALGVAFVTWAACALGAAVAYVQWDVARHNGTGRSFCGRPSVCSALWSLCPLWFLSASAAAAEKNHRGHRGHRDQTARAQQQAAPRRRGAASCSSRARSARVP
jgi:hypothetical protein